MRIGRIEAERGARSRWGEDERVGRRWREVNIKGQRCLEGRGQREEGQRRRDDGVK